VQRAQAVHGGREHAQPQLRVRERGAEGHPAYAHRDHGARAFVDVDHGRRNARVGDAPEEAEVMGKPRRVGTGRRDPQDVRPA
jgi:hypothetical protein